ncbi:Gfo/Idh/MocA family oxidoreductase [Rugosimonospora acidiphila]|uniref:Gfo/Idh/MocA family oxidoreductase n=1 Tax=Rugosimonospora acidiphila TaxID=556531 RepID=A0ABP9RS47_9ACTN
MRVGVLGVGRIGVHHAETLARHPDVADLVLADDDAERAREVAQRIGCRVVAGVDAAFAVGLDAVVVATPTATHPQMIIKAAGFGVPVFCEKPVADGIPATLEVLAQVEKTGTPVHIGFQRRFDAGYLAAGAALRAGELGELRRVHLVTADREPPPAQYVANSGGIFRDMHVHDFDILRAVTGREVVEVYATGANRGADYFGEAQDIDVSAAVLTLDDGTVATLQGSRYNGAGYDVRMELGGTKATWAVGLDDGVPLRSAEPAVDFPAGPSWDGFLRRFAPAYRAELGAFLDLARGRITSPCDVRDALRALYIAEAADLSRRLHRPVRIDEVQQ